MKYREKYGRYENAPDFKRCAAAVSSDGWSFGQCSRKAVCDPEDGHKATTCRQHSAAFVRAKDEKWRAKYDAKMDADRKRRERPRIMQDALQQIADGHNDPRQLAKDVLSRL